MISLVLILSLPILFFLLQKITKNGTATLHPPGPQGLPFIGILHNLHNNSYHLHLTQLSKTYGPLMSIRLGSVRALVVSSPEIAKQVMKTHDLQCCSRPTMLGQKTLSYNQKDIAFSPYNVYWREMKKICTLHLFSSQRVKSFRRCREEEVYHMIKKIANLATSSKLINVNESAIYFASNIISRIAFGNKCDEDGCERSRFQSLLAESQTMLGSFFFSDYFPMLSWVDRANGMCARLEKTFKKLDLFYQELIDDHLNPERKESMTKDLIDILLELMKDQTTSVDLTMDHIKAVLMDIFVAGTDTMAAAITWAMTALIKHPRSLKKVQEELRNLVFGKKDFLDEDDVQNLPYLNAVIKETLRLYPPAPVPAPRETIQKCNINGYEIAPNTVIFINTWAVQRDPKAWHNPEDFLPERFMGSEINFKGQDFELIPFGSGRRCCPGINLGSNIVLLVLANILYAFDWALPNGMKGEMVDTNVLPGLTMHKKEPLCLVATNYTI